MRERGFTLVEVLVALAIFVAVGMTALGIVSSLLRASRQGASNGGPVALEQQIDAMRSDAATSFAVFVPARDVLGRPNAPSGGVGHEVDFYSKTDSGAQIFWAYLWDGKRDTLRRYDYDAAGVIGEADRQTGRIDTNGRYPALPGVTAFSAETLEASDLPGTKNVYASVLAPLFANAPPPGLPVGFQAYGTARSDLFGGNTTVQIEMSTLHEMRIVHLATAALPSGFTVHGRPEIRAIVYRRDTTDRSWLGLVQKSHVFVQAQLLVSYSHFTEPHPIVWCDYNIYGYPGGLEAPYQADADYQPTWFSETTAGIVYHVTHGKTNGSHCSKTPPGPGAQPATSDFFTPPPDRQATPPPSWCEAHANSMLCAVSLRRSR